MFDIRHDPGETRDLQAELPDRFKAMQAAYAAYALANGVLDMPAGYDPIHQVLVNALVNVYVPRYRPAALALLAVLAAAVLVWWRRRARAGPRSTSAVGPDSDRP